MPTRCYIVKGRTINIYTGRYVSVEWFITEVRLLKKEGRSIYICHVLNYTWFYVYRKLFNTVETRPRSIFDRLFSKVVVSNFVVRL